MEAGYYKAGISSRRSSHHTYAHHILVHLDALFDLRLAAVSRLNDKEALRLFMNDWALRKTDVDLLDNEFFTHDEYRKELNNPDKEVLKTAKITRMITFLDDMVADISKESTMNNTDNNFKLTVNIYPYQLSKDEILEFKALLFNQIPLLENIDIISMSRSMVTPSFITSNKIQYFITYEWDKWINQHADLLAKHPIPTLYLIGPRLAETDVTKSVGSKDLDKELIAQVDPFEYLSYIYSLQFNLKFIHQAYFSDVRALLHDVVIDPNEKDENLNLKGTPVETLFKKPE